MLTSKMTAQEVFDHVAAHLRAQNEVCADATAMCTYRQERNGKMLKCAAGCLIDDEEYAGWMDSRDRSTAIEHILRDARCPDSMVERLLPHLSLIQQLQNIHDQTSPQDWEQELDDVAFDLRLIYIRPKDSNP